MLANGKNHLVIAGPCSAESLSQLESIASSFDDIYKPDFFRAGIWKPRSSPHDFEGMGDQALEWLLSIREKFNVPIITEVSTPQHVQWCKKYNFDALWIGARTCGNPFAMEELADSLSGTDIPVFLKNPLIPDLKLWKGSADRLLRKGVYLAGLIHRGFTVYEESIYRNNPLWHFASEIKNEFPYIPLLCDPSHMAGKASYVGMLAHHALEMEMDGWMIEVHNDPSSALSDAAQQISPADYIALMKSLQGQELWAESGVSLEELRRELDETDLKLLHVLAARMDIINRMGKLKKNNHISVLQSERWRSVLQSRIDKGLALGLNDAFVSDIFTSIHEESISMQLKIKNND